ncbi:MAG: Uncharacterized protein G01um101425_728 [Candidatus Peregrinibacteria bacterium Gr01-1014_25]|nr:MAG: Uncharacterized protein G01um101425_728 [Candidatus Peregrinibacteria bacterium Gr01-1014_25]
MPDALKHTAALEQWLAPVFRKAPHLPPKARQTLVTIAPWLALVFGVLGVLAILSTGMLASMFFSFTMMLGGMTSIALLIALLASLLSAILELLAVKPLLARRKTGWNLLFYGMLVSTLSFIANAIIGYGSLVGVVALVIGYWLLFEVREEYR